MADQTITQSDIAALASKLDEVADVLTDKEKALLLGVFKLAGQALANRVSGVSGGGGRKVALWCQLPQGSVSSQADLRTLSHRSAAQT